MIPRPRIGLGTFPTLQGMQSIQRHEQTAVTFSDVLKQLDQDFCFRVIIRISTLDFFSIDIVGPADTGSKMRTESVERNKRLEKPARAMPAFRFRSLCTTPTARHQEVISYLRAL